MVRAANLLAALGEADAAAAYLDHAESLGDDDGELVSGIAYLRHKIAQMRE